MQIMRRQPGFPRIEPQERSRVSPSMGISAKAQRASPELCFKSNYGCPLRHLLREAQIQESATFGVFQTYHLRKAYEPLNLVASNCLWSLHGKGMPKVMLLHALHLPQ